MVVWFDELEQNDLVICDYHGLLSDRPYLQHLLSHIIDAESQHVPLKTKRLFYLGFSQSET